MKDRLILKKKIFFIAILIFLSTFLIYFLSNPFPPQRFKHHVYLADAFLHGRLDIQNFPNYYHEIVKFNHKFYIPFPPSPAVLLMPIILIFGTSFKQQYLSMLIGAINSFLIWFLFKEYKFQKRIILTLFYSFGTVAWYSAVIGTTWYYALTCGNFFLLLSLIFFLRKKQFFYSGFFLGLASLSHHPILLGVIFFLPYLLKRKKNLFKFMLGLIVILFLQLIYNYLRFGNIFQEGYLLVFQTYLHSSYPYSIFQVWFSNYKFYGYLNPRYIPAHLATLFLILPKKIKNFPFLEPSPYGMSVFLTSPLFIYLAKANYKKKIVQNSLLAVIGIFLLISFHYMQGWVQFGYRYLIDFLPFLMIILADGLSEKATFWTKFLLLFSILSNYFGIYWGKKLGW